MINHKTGGVLCFVYKIFHTRYMLGLMFTEKFVLKWFSRRKIGSSYGNILAYMYTREKFTQIFCEYVNMTGFPSLPGEKNHTNIRMSRVFSDGFLSSKISRCVPTILLSLLFNFVQQIQKQIT